MGRTAYGVDVQQLGDACGWTCWICGGGIDRAGPAGGPWSASVDHVLPRARGGTNDPANLRLAHRRCNGARGSALPELEWPRDLSVLDAAPVWPVVQPALRRPGDWEVVGVLPGADAAARAAEWLAAAVPRIVGGEWGVRHLRLGAGELETLSLRAVALRAVTPAGAAVPARRAPARRRARR
jgi:hypothetical protein